MALALPSLDRPASGLLFSPTGCARPVTISCCMGRWPFSAIASFASFPFPPGRDAYGAADLPVGVHLGDATLGADRWPAAGSQSLCRVVRTGGASIQPLALPERCRGLCLLKAGRLARSAALSLADRCLSDEFRRPPLCFGIQPGPVEPPDRQPSPDTPRSTLVGCCPDSCLSDYLPWAATTLARKGRNIGIGWIHPPTLGFAADSIQSPPCPQ